MKISLTLFLILVSLISRGQDKTIYEDNSIFTKNIKLEKLDAYSPNNTVIVFTSGFWSYFVHIINNEKVVYKTVTTTPVKGFATFEVFRNDSDIIVKFFLNGSSQTITLNKTDLKKYKYAYISNENNQENRGIIITYSNETKYSF